MWGKFHFFHVCAVTCPHPAGGGARGDDFGTKLGVASWEKAFSDPGIAETTSGKAAGAGDSPRSCFPDHGLTAPECSLDSHWKALQ